jgi:hypothetical protein
MAIRIIYTFVDLFHKHLLTILNKCLYSPTSNKQTQTESEMKPTPFSRAIAMMHAIAEAMRLTGSAQSDAMGKIGAYQSRGKGRGPGFTRVNFMSKAGRSKYVPHIGAKESAKFIARQSATA